MAVTITRVPSQEQPMWIDEEVWLPRSKLVGLQFADAADFEQCRAFLWEDPDRYCEIYSRSQLIVVRKTDAHLFAGAGLRYTEVELFDPDALSPEERYEAEKAMVQEAMALFVERLRREQ
jgi:hypothetical protein